MLRSWAASPARSADSTRPRSLLRKHSADSSPIPRQSRVRSGRTSPSVERSSVTSARLTGSERNSTIDDPRLRRDASRSGPASGRPSRCVGKLGGGRRPSARVTRCARSFTSFATCARGDMRVAQSTTRARRPALDPRRPVRARANAVERAGQRGNTSVAANGHISPRPPS